MSISIQDVAETENNILVIGDDLSDHKNIINNMFSNRNINLENQKEIHKIDDNKQTNQYNNDDFVLHQQQHVITTKYYTAKLNFYVVPDSVVINIINNNDKHNIIHKFSPHWKKFHATIITYKAFNNKSFYRVTNFIERIQCHTSDIEIRLCLQNHFSSNSNSNSSNFSTSEAVDWCIDNGFEHIILPENEEELEINDNNEMGYFGSSEGLPRAVEALKSTIWPQLDPPPSSLGSSSVSSTVSSKVEKKESSSEETIKTNNHLVQNKNNNKNKSNQNNNNNNNTPTTDNDILNLLGKTSYTVEDDPEDGEDKEMEMLLNQMMLLRNSGESLPQEERRKRAGKIAMELFDKLDIGEEEEGGYSSSEDENNTEDNT